MEWIALALTESGITNNLFRRFMPAKFLLNVEEKVPPKPFLV